VSATSTNAIDLDIGRPGGIVQIDERHRLGSRGSDRACAKSGILNDVPDQLDPASSRNNKRALRRKRQKDFVVILQILADAGRSATTGMSKLGQVIGGSDPLKASELGRGERPGRQDDFMRRLRLMDLPVFDVFDPDRPLTVEQHPVALASVTRVNRSSPITGFKNESAELRRFPRKVVDCRTPRRAVDRP